MERVTFRFPELGFAIPVPDFQAWLDAAPPKSAILYAHGLVPPRQSATWVAAREAEKGGLVTLTSQKVKDAASGARVWHWMAVRLELGAAHDAPASDLHPDAERILKAFRRCAAFDLEAPTNSELADDFGLPNADRARYLVKGLIDALVITVVDHGPRRRRIVTIRAEGTGCGKSTRAGAL